MCARVRVCECVDVRACECVGVCECVNEYLSVRECVFISARVHPCSRVCVRACVRVCVRNQQISMTYCYVYTVLWYT